MLLAAGDIAACASAGDRATAAILDANPGIVATLGDNAQGNGSLDEFLRCYHPSWGRHLHRTRPSVGNHEYRTPGAAGYWSYFGSRAGSFGKAWYSYDVGDWHVIVLDSNCFAIGCEPGSEQERWLRSDLAASDADCTLAYFHHSRFSSARTYQLQAFRPMWEALYQHGADVVLSAHDHIYERHAAQTPTGDPRRDYGIRQFIVGTGGHSHARIVKLLPTSEAANADTYGVLKVTLRPGAYEWAFLPEAGKTFTDSGRDTCHGPPPDRTPPSAALAEPAHGTLVRGTRALRATAADDSAVARVDFLLDGFVIASDDSAPYAVEWESASANDGVRPLVARAVDAAGNAGDSKPASLVVDNGLPETRIRRAPPVDARLRTATFGFASEPGATFTCLLDGKPLTPCRSPVRLADLAPGRHAFAVRARDAAGKLDPTPARHAWRVDVEAPRTKLVYSSTSRGSGGVATFRFTASERRVSFQCSLDGAAWAACASPHVVENVGRGRHSLRIRARDAAANVGWAGATHTWFVARRATGVVVTGSSGRDVLIGTPGDDVVDGSGGNDALRGLGGDDLLLGGTGADRLDGGIGDDRLNGGAGRDALLGRAGRDELEARDGTADSVNGGPARDVASVDRGLDRLRAIERRRF